MGIGFLGGRSNFVRRENRYAFSLASEPKGNPRNWQIFRYSVDFDGYGLYRTDLVKSARLCSTQIRAWLDTCFE